MRPVRGLLPTLEHPRRDIQRQMQASVGHNDHAYSALQIGSAGLCYRLIWHSLPIQHRNSSMHFLQALHQAMQIWLLNDLLEPLSRESC